MTKIEILKFYQTYKFFLFPSIVVISALILLVFVIYPQTIKLLTNQKSASDITKKVAFLENKVQAMEGYNPEDLKIKVDSALSSYPVDKDLAIIIGLMQDITAKSGFNISSLSLGSGGKKDGNAQSYIIKLETIGLITSLPGFLKNLESSTRLLRISSIDVSIGKDQAVNLGLIIEALYASAPEDFGSIDSPIPELSQEEQVTLTKLARAAPVSIQTSVPSQTSIPTEPVITGPVGRDNPFE